MHWTGHNPDSYLIDCLSDLFVYFKVHIHEVKNLFKVKRLGLPQVSSVEPGIVKEPLDVSW